MPTRAQESLIISKHCELGNKWAIIARSVEAPPPSCLCPPQPSTLKQRSPPLELHSRSLPGRAHNDIKNIWHRILKLRCKMHLKEGGVRIKLEERPGLLEPPPVAKRCRPSKYIC